MNVVRGHADASGDLLLLPLKVLSDGLLTQGPHLPFRAGTRRAWTCHLLPCAVNRRPLKVVSRAGLSPAWCSFSVVGWPPCRRAWTHLAAHCSMTSRIERPLCSSWCPCGDLPSQGSKTLDLWVLLFTLNHTGKSGAARGTCTPTDCSTGS